MQVLIIEDDDDLRHTIETGLSRSGFDVTVASGGREGLEMVRSGSFNVVVTDIVMDQGEGIETLRWIESEKPGTPVIGISGRGEYLRLMSDLGAAATLQKPFKIAELAKVIESVAV
jgi:DNA-binding response OmpR family regulator